MSVDTTKAMEEALQAAVSRMTRSDGAGAGAAAADPLGMLMSLLPKLLESNEEREDLVEKFDVLEKETFSPLNDQMKGLRKQVHRISKMQEELLEEIRELREQQTAVGNAVLHLAKQMARIEIVDDMGDAGDEYDDEDDEVLEDADVYDNLPSALAADPIRPRQPVTTSRKRPRPRRRG